MKKYIAKIWKKVIFKLTMILSILSLYSFPSEASTKQLEELEEKENYDIAKEYIEDDNEIVIEQAYDDYDKKIEEYLTLLEILGKTQSEYQSMMKTLIKIKEALNVSPKENILYSDIISIGDATITIDNYVPIYATNEDLYNGTNYKTSYYGTKEIRLVSKIVMAKKDTIIEVDNMDDYELFKEIGFSVIGYKTVNQYSLQEDGTLKEEGEYEEESVRLVFKPKQKARVPEVKKLPC